MIRSPGDRRVMELVRELAPGAYSLIELATEVGADVADVVAA